MENSTKLKIGAIIAAGLLTTSGALVLKYKKETDKANEKVIEMTENITNLQNNSVKLINELKFLKEDYENNKELIIEKQSELDNITLQLNDVKTSLNEKEQEIIDLTAEISSEVASESKNGYLIDDVKLDENFEILLKDNRVETLIDNEIDFNDETYKVEEQIIISDDFKPLTSASIDDEFGKNIYVGTTKTDSVKYKYVFKDDIDFTEVRESEPLKINFLGKELEIINIDSNGNKIKYKETSESTLSIGESLLDIKVLNIGENSVILQYGDETKVIDEDEDFEFDDITVKVKSIFYVDDKEGRMTILEVGKELSNTVETGDSMELFGEPEDEDDALWVWDISLSGTDSYIGAKLNQKMDDLDEEFKPLKAGEQLIFPNDYVAITYLGTNDVDYNDMDVDFDDNYIVIKSDTENILSDNKNYDKIYIDDTGIYVKEDGNYNLITNVNIQQEDDNLLPIIINGNLLTISDLVIEVNYADEKFVSIKYNSLDRIGHDNDLVMDNGIIIKDVENNFEDDIIELEIPTEQVSVELKIE